MEEYKDYYVLYWLDGKDTPEAIYEIKARDKDEAKDQAEWLRDGRYSGTHDAIYEAGVEMPPEQIKDFIIRDENIEYHKFKVLDA